LAREFGVLDTGNGMGVFWDDLDADGRLDLYVSNMSSSAGNRILRRLTSRAAAAPAPSAGSAPRIAPGEGSAPRAEAAAAPPPISAVEQTLLKLASGNTIFRQSASGFDRLPADHGGVSASWAWSASALDIDLDGVRDIYVANGFISGDSLKDT
jgi:hypothetical protein